MENMMGVISKSENGFYEWEKTHKIVISDLISKRNSVNNKSIESFDAVLLYYLGEKNFEKYVKDGVKVE